MCILVKLTWNRYTHPMTREWDNRTSHPPTHRPLTSLLVPWPNHSFPMRVHVRRPRPLILPSLPTKEEFNPGQVFLRPPLGAADDSEVLLYSDGSKTGERVGAAFVHLQPSDSESITESHLLPLSCNMAIPNAELYAAAKPPSDNFPWSYSRLRWWHASCLESLDT